MPVYEMNLLSVAFLAVNAMLTLQHAFQVCPWPL